MFHLIKKTGIKLNVRQNLKLIMYKASAHKTMFRINTRQRLIIMAEKVSSKKMD